MISASAVYNHGHCGSGLMLNVVLTFSTSISPSCTNGRRGHLLSRCVACSCRSVLRWYHWLRSPLLQPHNKRGGDQRGNSWWVVLQTFWRVRFIASTRRHKDTGGQTTSIWQWKKSLYWKCIWLSKGIFLMWVTLLWLYVVQVRLVTSSGNGVLSEQISLGNALELHECRYLL